MSSHTRQFQTLGASRKRKERDAHVTTKDEPGPTPPAGNRLLAGYLAHEFLTCGSLFGKRWDPAKGTDSNRTDPVRAEPAEKPAAAAYADVARLLKMDGAHIKGIVNPTELGRWLQM